MGKGQDNTLLRVHVALNTSHFQESLEFYEALLGTKPSKLKPGYAKFEPHTPALNLTLNAATGVGGNQINHFGIEVHSSHDVWRQKDRFQALGLKTLTEEATTCCYALQDKVWIQDPDGNSWEVFFVLDDSPPERVEAPATTSACCG